jgi:hypothetical protein
VEAQASKEGELGMGFEHVDQVLESDRYKGPTKAVLTALAHHMNEKRNKNEVWPGKSRLSAVSGWKETTVEKALDQLIADGVVEVKSPGVGRESTHYLIHLDKMGRSQDSLPVGHETARGGVSYGPGVGCETSPNKELELEKRKQEAENNNSAAPDDVVSSSQTQNQINPHNRSTLSTPENAPSPSALELGKYFYNTSDPNSGLAKKFASLIQPWLGKTKADAATVKYIIDFSRQGDFWPVRCATPKGFVSCLEKGSLARQAKDHYKKSKRFGKKLSSAHGGDDYIDLEAR